jgi:hypothetical protein
MGAVQDRRPGTRSWVRLAGLQRVCAVRYDAKMVGCSGAGRVSVCSKTVRISALTSLRMTEHKASASTFIPIPIAACVCGRASRCAVWRVSHTHGGDGSRGRGCLAAPGCICCARRWILRPPAGWVSDKFTYPFHVKSRWHMAYGIWHMAYGRSQSIDACPPASL